MWGLDELISSGYIRVCWTVSDGGAKAGAWLATVRLGPAECRDAT
jgi:hypothetical protein